MRPSDMAATPARSVTKLPLARLAALAPTGRPSVSPSSWSLPDPDVGQEELAGGRGVQAHLAEGLGLLQPGHAPVEDEGEHRALA